MGAKYIVEVEDKPFELLSEDGFTSEKLFRVKGFNSLVFDRNGLNMLTPYTEPDLEQVRKEAYEKGYETAKHEYEDCTKPVDNGKAYQMGLSDAWEAARKICLDDDDGGIPASVVSDIFNVRYYRYALRDFSATEVIEKIRQYEQEKEEQIQVGDEVEAAFGKATVTETTEKHVYYFYADGSYGFDEKEHVTKTGRHFPEIATVLEKMKEADNG